MGYTNRSVKPVRARSRKGTSQQQVCNIVNEKVGLSGKNQVGTFHLQSWRNKRVLKLGHQISQYRGYTEEDIVLTCKVAFLRQVLGVELAKMDKALAYLNKQNEQQLATHTSVGAQAKG